jgi:putative oxidoreductase
VVSVDIASVVLRVAIGATMLAHGYNHAFGGGKLAGTARWFESIGIQPGLINAGVATLTELGSGALLICGIITPIAAAGVIGTMTVALVANHLRNGYFIFRPGEGYEYVLNLILASGALGAIGGGRLSLDYAAGFHVNGWGGLLLAVGPGLAGAVALLAACWRPSSASVRAPAGQDPAGLRGEQ